MCTFSSILAGVLLAPANVLAGVLLAPAKELSH